MAMTSRFPSSFEPNPVTRALSRARAAGQPLLDLTVTNPTRAGVHYDPEILAPLAAPQSLIYEPVPLGLATARAAVSADYRRRHVEIPPDRIVLTASTSEAYAWLFKLCCRPTDDEVLIPAPSYPLFDHLTRMDGVRAVPYRLDYHGRWALDVASLDDAWSDMVRAVLVVSPNNPTGSVLGAEELQAIYFQQKGVDPQKDTISYCRIGERSSHTWFVLKYLLGLKNVKNYDGSWTEYGNVVGAPIEKEVK